MNILSLRWNSCKSILKQNAHIALCVLLPVTIMVTVYALMGIYPFGARSVFAIDLNTQYSEYFTHVKDILSGRESPFYSWNQSLSSEFSGTYAYYLASPFNIIAWAFPVKYLQEGILLTILAKIGAIGLTMAVFLNKHRGYNKQTTILFSCSYALTSYTLLMTLNLMWLDGVFILPLIVMGTERLADKGTFKLIVISWFYGFVSCFYIGYMLGVFSVLYFIYYMISRENLNAKFFAKKSGHALLCGAVSVMLSSSVLLAVYNALSLGKLEYGESADFTLKENFHILSAFGKLLPNSYDTFYSAAKPFIYCGIITLIMTAVYFIKQNVTTTRKKVYGAIFLLIMLLSMYIKPADMLWHGGQEPGGYPYRYSFMFCFLLIIFGAEAYNSIKWKKKRYKWSYALCAFVICELFYNAYGSNIKFSGESMYTYHDRFPKLVMSGRRVISDIKKNDSGFYRTEAEFMRFPNDPMSFNMYGVSCDTSVTKTNAAEYLGALGFESHKYRTTYQGATDITNDILGFKYILKCTDNDYTNIKTYSDITVKKNETALPVAYLVDSKIKHYRFSKDTEAVFENQNGLINAMTNSDNTYYVNVKQDETLFNLTYSERAGGYRCYEKKDKDVPAALTYTLTAETDGNIYMYLPCEDSYLRNVEVKINGKDSGKYHDTLSHYIKNLGYAKKGETVTAELSLKAEKLFFTEARFTQTSPRYAEALNKLNDINKNNTVTVSKKGTKFTIDVAADQHRVLYTTIPKENGWKAAVDGKPAKLLMLQDCMAGVEVTAGHHILTLTYTPPYIYISIIITLFGIITFFIMIVTGKKHEKV